jgi:hypothetical protein
MGVSRLYRASTPFNASELADVDFTQSFDTVYLAHQNHVPGKFQRYGHTDWRYANLTFGALVPAPTSVAAVATNPNQDTPNSGAAYFPQDCSYVITAVNEGTGQESLPSLPATATNDLTLKRNYNTITWAAVTGLTPETTATYYKIYKRRNQGEYGYMGQTEQLTFRDDNIIPDLTDGPPTHRNPMAAAGDYPACVFFIDQRLGWGNTTNNPNAIYISRAADFENMDVAKPVKADDAITVRLVADKVNAVRQCLPMDNLLGLTSTGIFVITGSNDDYLAANPPPKARRRSSRGVAKLRAIIVDTVAFYTLDKGQGVYSLGYSFEQNGQKSSDVSIFSPHLFKGRTITSWAYAEQPHSVIWASLDDGTVVSFTWEQDQDVWGWTGPHNFGGFVNFVAAVPEAGEHRVYMSISRVIGTTTRHFIERMSSVMIPTDPAYECYLDSAVSQTFPSPTTVVGGLAHLQGAAVTALADGNAIEGLSVVNGLVTLPYAASVVTIGLPFQGTMESLPVIYPFQGTNAGKRQSAGKIAIKVADTRGIKVGRRESSLTVLRTRTNEVIGQALSRATGTFEASAEPVQSAETTLLVRQDKPFSWKVLAIYLDPIAAE